MPLPSYAASSVAPCGRGTCCRVCGTAS